MHLHAIQDQAGLTSCLKRKTIDQPDNGFLCDSESSGTHILFPAETPPVSQIINIDTVFIRRQRARTIYRAFSKMNPVPEL